MYLILADFFPQGFFKWVKFLIQWLQIEVKWSTSVWRRYSQSPTSLYTSSSLAAERAGKSFTCAPLGLKARTFCGPKVPEWAIPMSHHLIHTPHALTLHTFLFTIQCKLKTWVCKYQLFFFFLLSGTHPFFLMKYSLHYHHLASCGRYWHCGDQVEPIMIWACALESLELEHDMVKWTSMDNMHTCTTCTKTHACCWLETRRRI